MRGLYYANVSEDDLRAEFVAIKQIMIKCWNADCINSRSCIKDVYISHLNVLSDNDFW